MRATPLVPFSRSPRYQPLQRHGPAGSPCMDDPAHADVLPGLRRRVQRGARARTTASSPPQPKQAGLRGQRKLRQQQRDIVLGVVDKVRKRQGAEGVRALFRHPRMQPALQATVGSSIDAKICDGVANMMMLMKAKRGGQIKHHERMRSTLLHACCGRLQRGDVLPMARRLGCSRKQVTHAVRRARDMHAGIIPVNAASRRVSKRRVTAAQVYTAIAAWVEDSYPSPGRNSVHMYPQPALVGEVTKVRLASQQSVRFHHDSGLAIWRAYRSKYGAQGLGLSLLPQGAVTFTITTCLNLITVQILGHASIYTNTYGLVFEFDGYDRVA